MFAPYHTHIPTTSNFITLNTSLLNVPSACPHAANYVDHLNVHRRVGKHDDHSAAVVNVPAPVIL